MQCIIKAYKYDDTRGIGTREHGVYIVTNTLDLKHIYIATQISAKKKKNVAMFQIHCNT